MNSPPPTAIMMTPTPPLLSRSKLPSTSPSSARLRRLAPSPVKVPPTPPLILSPPRVLACHANLGAALLTTASAVLVPRESGQIPEDPFEYDFAPLELAMQSDDLLESCQEVLEQCRDVAARRNSSIDSNSSVPLIFDVRGDFGTLAQKVRDIDGPDVPHESHADGSLRLTVDRGGDALMSPRDYFATCVPKDVLVEFRDVFGSTSIASLAVSPSDPLEQSRLTRDTSLADSFATFGCKNRRKSAGSMQEDDDGWSYTLSAYGSDVEEEDPLGYRPRRYTSIRSPTIPDIPEPLPPIPPHMRFLPPQTDSPLSLPPSELVTPDQQPAELPVRYFHSISSDSPTPKLPRSDLHISLESSGLQLELAPKRSDLPIVPNFLPALKVQGPRMLYKDLPLLPNTPRTLPTSGPAETRIDSYDTEVETTLSNCVEKVLQSVDRNITIQLQADQVSYGWPEKY